MENRGSAVERHINEHEAGASRLRVATICAVAGAIAGLAFGPVLNHLRFGWFLVPALAAIGGIVGAMWQSWSGANRDLNSAPEQERIRLNMRIFAWGAIVQFIVITTLYIGRYAFGLF
jgi:hypothetical protein